MTVAELIVELQKLPQDADAFPSGPATCDACGEPTSAHASNCPVLIFETMHPELPPVPPSSPT